MAGPGILATITLSSIIVAALYTGQFADAVDPLRWICLGMGLRIISWPMGYIIVAKGRQVLYFATELAWAVVNVGLSWVLVHAFGLLGAGIAFFGSYVFHALMIYPVVRWLTGFRWTTENLRIGLLFLSSIALVFAGFALLTPGTAMILGALATLASALHSVYLLARLSDEVVPARLKRLLFVIRALPTRS
jgi:PST family polysaccharide transporter